MNYTTLPNGDTVASPDELPQMLEVEEGFLDGLPAKSLGERCTRFGRREKKTSRLVLRSALPALRYPGFFTTAAA